VNMVFQRSEEGFEPLEDFSGFLAKFLVVGDGAVDFDDPGEVLSFGDPGFDHVWGGEPVEAHVEFYGVQLCFCDVPVQGFSCVPVVGPSGGAKVEACHSSNDEHLVLSYPFFCWFCVALIELSQVRRVGWAQ